MLLFTKTTKINTKYYQEKEFNEKPNFGIFGRVSMIFGAKTNFTTVVNDSSFVYILLYVIDLQVEMHANRDRCEKQFSTENDIIMKQNVAKERSNSFNERLKKQ